MAAESPIYTVVIGIHRAVAEQTEELLAGTPFKVSAILDLAESPDVLQYSPQNLAVVLNALYPRPRVLLTGTAVPDDMLPAIETAWEEYVQRWRVDGLWLAMSKTHPSPGGPPPPGALEYAMETLKKKFQE